MPARSMSRQRRVFEGSGELKPTRRGVGTSGRGARPRRRELLRAPCEKSCKARCAFAVRVRLFTLATSVKRDCHLHGYLLGQVWKISYITDWRGQETYARIINPATQLAGDVGGSNRANRARVIGWPLNGSGTANQLWSIQYAKAWE